MKPARDSKLLEISERELRHALDVLERRGRAPIVNDDALEEGVGVAPARDLVAPSSREHVFAAISARLGVMRR